MKKCVKNRKIKPNKFAYRVSAYPFDHTRMSY